MKFLPYVRHSIDASDIEAAADALRGELITRGPLVEQFEKAMAAYCGASYAVAFNSGTAALMAAYHAAQLNEHDRLITTPISFVATVGAAVQCKAAPVFIDIDRSCGNLNLEYIPYNTERMRSRGRSVIAPVHFAGIAVDMQKLDSSIYDPNSIVIEDAAHAIGSVYPSGEKVGSCAWSQMTIFSFHPAKNMTTGEGGMVTTNDPELDHLLRLYRNNGIERDPHYLEREPQPWYYEVQELTGNYNFTEMQAALGLSQLKRLDGFIEKRRQLVACYRKELKGMENVELFSVEHDERTAYHLFVVQIDFKAYKKTRQEVMLKLRDKGVGTQVLYIPIYKHPFFRQLHQEDLSPYFPETELYYERALALPLYYDLTPEDVNYVCETLKQILR